MVRSIGAVVRLSPALSESEVEDKDFCNITF